MATLSSYCGEYAAEIQSIAAGGISAVIESQARARQIECAKTRALKLWICDEAMTLVSVRGS